MSDPWQKLSESAQSIRISTIDNLAASVVRRACAIIAGNGFNHIPVTIGKFTVKPGEAKSEFTCTPTSENVNHLLEMQGRGSILVLIDSDTYMGEREQANPDKDQPVLPIDEPAEQLENA
jgi:hypothetical protein